MRSKDFDYAVDECLGDDNPSLLGFRLLNYADICSIDVHFKNGRTSSFLVPYDPLYDLVGGYEVDWSNCCSSENDENGTILVLFGKSSHCFRRIDNNFDELILGYDKISKIKRQNKVDLPPLKLSIYEIQTQTTTHSCPRLCIAVYIKNKAVGSTLTELIFEDYFDLSMCARPEVLQDELEFYAARTEQGDIFVQFGEQFRFRCHGIVAEAYEGDGGDECFHLDDYTNYKTLLAAEYEKLKASSISVEQFAEWIRSCAESLCYGDEINLDKDPEAAKDALLLDRLAIKLQYYHSYFDCKEMIDETIRQIIK